SNSLALSAPDLTLRAAHLSDAPAHWCGSGLKRGETMVKRPQNGAKSRAFFRDFRRDFDVTCCPENELPSITGAAVVTAVRKQQMERDFKRKTKPASTASPGAIQRKSLTHEAHPARQEKKNHGGNGFRGHFRHETRKL